MFPRSTLAHRPVDFAVGEAANERNAAGSTPSIWMNRPLTLIVAASSVVAAATPGRRAMALVVADGSVVGATTSRSASCSAPSGGIAAAAFAALPAPAGTLIAGRPRADDDDVSCAPDNGDPAGTANRPRRCRAAVGRAAVGRTAAGRTAAGRTAADGPGVLGGRVTGGGMPGGRMSGRAMHGGQDPADADGGAGGQRRHGSQNGPETTDVVAHQHSLS